MAAFHHQTLLRSPGRLPGFSLSKSLFWRNWQEQGCGEQDSTLIRKNYLALCGSPAVRTSRSAIVTRLRAQRKADRDKRDAKHQAHHRHAPVGRSIPRLGSSVCVGFELQKGQQQLIPLAGKMGKIDTGQFLVYALRNRPIEFFAQG
jgi:hypothetical protein